MKLRCGRNSNDENIEKYADQHLFQPLGISNYKWRYNADSTSINTYNQMYITPRDLIKLASIYLKKGRYGDQQIISEYWVNNSLKSDGGSYGYLWKYKRFEVNGKIYYSYVAKGNGGQNISIWPELDMITVFTGGNYNSYELYGKTSAPNKILRNYILPSL